MVWGVLVWFGVFWSDSMDPGCQLFAKANTCEDVALLCTKLNVKNSHFQLSFRASNDKNLQ